MSDIKFILEDRAKWESKMKEANFYKTLAEISSAVSDVIDNANSFHYNVPFFNKT